MIDSGGSVMKYEKIILGSNKNVTLTTYILDDFLNTPKPSIVICPGGGFLDCSPREGECVAMHFAALGFHTFVLNYSTQKNTSYKGVLPQALRDLGEAMCLIRKRAGEWNVDTDKIAVLGFSAGGQLAALYGNLWNSARLDTIGIPEERRPNAIIVSYGLIDMWEHRKMFEWIMQDDKKTVDMQIVTGTSRELRIRNFWKQADIAQFGKCPPLQKEIDSVDAIRYIGSNTPPTFLWHTFEDEIVSPVQALHYAEALYRNQIPCEVHIFERGRHGLSLANETSAEKKEQAVPHVAHWTQLAAEWLEELFQ